MKMEEELDYSSISSDFKQFLSVGQVTSIKNNCCETVKHRFDGNFNRDINLKFVEDLLNKLHPHTKSVFHNFPLVLRKEYSIVNFVNCHYQYLEITEKGELTISVLGSLDNLREKLVEIIIGTDTWEGGKTNLARTEFYCQLASILREKK